MINIFYVLHLDRNQKWEKASKKWPVSRNNYGWIVFLRTINSAKNVSKRNLRFVPYSPFPNLLSNKFSKILLLYSFIKETKENRRLTEAVVRYSTLYSIKLSIAVFIANKRKKLPGTMPIRLFCSQTHFSPTLTGPAYSQRPALSAADIQEYFFWSSH